MKNECPIQLHQKIYLTNSFFFYQVSFLFCIPVNTQDQWSCVSGEERETYDVEILEFSVLFSLCHCSRLKLRMSHCAATWETQDKQKRSIHHTEHSIPASVTQAIQQSPPLRAWTRHLQYQSMCQVGHGRCQHYTAELKDQSYNTVLIVTLWGFGRKVY